MTLEEKLALVGKMLDDVPANLAKFKKDGLQVEAFYNDLKAAFDKAKNNEERGMYVDMAYVLMAKAYECAKGVSFWKVISFQSRDPFKPMRLMADEIAVKMGFENYKKLRGL